VKEQITKFWMARTPRERALVGGLGLFLAIMILWPGVVQPISQAFARQSRELQDITLTYTAAPDIMARYAKLVARRKELEKFYSGVDVSSDPLSYLEKLLRDTAKASGTYNVTPREGAQLGGKYAHKLFIVNFQSASLENVAAFLKELTTGPQPMLISQINLDRRATTSMLNVQLEVSGFETIASGR
jgi:type II secretory pathway component PulM